MDLMHKVCGGPVFLDVTDFFKIQTRLRNFSINDKVVYISDLRIDTKADESTKFNFICAKCGKENLDYSVVLGQCGSCGEYVPITEIVTSPRLEGKTCKKERCSSYINKYGLIPLTDTLIKIRLG